MIGLNLKCGVFKILNLKTEIAFLSSDAFITYYVYTIL